MARLLFIVAGAVVFPVLTAGSWIFLEQIDASVPTVLFIGLSQLATLLVFGLCYELLAPAKVHNITNDSEMRELLASRTQFQMLYENSPVPYITIDDSETITMYNLSAVRLFNTTKTDMLNTNFMTCMVDDEDGKLGVVTGKLKSRSVIADEEIQITAADGEVKWVLLSVYASNTLKTRLLSLVDITEKKKVDIAKTEFVALATHQLRTPIAAIRWNMELLEKHIKSCLTEKSSDYLDKVNRNITRMIMLINDFLSVSKLETGTFAAEAERIELKSYFATVAEEFTQTIREKQITLNTTTEPVDFVFETDRRLFHIITSNLLSNAVKYLEAGGTINWGYQSNGETLTITVADNGIGIPAAEQENLFTKFYRSSNAMRHQSEGTGLGLYVLKQSVEQLGGNISFTSEENVGTTFVVTLPI